MLKSAKTALLLATTFVMTNINPMINQEEMENRFDRLARFITDIYNFSNIKQMYIKELTEKISKNNKKLEPLLLEHREMSPGPKQDTLHIKVLKIQAHNQLLATELKILHRSFDKAKQCYIKFYEIRAKASELYKKPGVIDCIIPWKIIDLTPSVCEIETSDPINSWTPSSLDPWCE